MALPLRGGGVYGLPLIKGLNGTAIKIFFAASLRQLHIFLIKNTEKEQLGVRGAVQKKVICPLRHIFLDGYPQTVDSRQKEKYRNTEIQKTDMQRNAEIQNCNNTEIQKRYKEGSLTEKEGLM